MNKDEIIDLINSIENTKSKKIIEYDAFAINIDGLKGVAIENKNNILISESFNRVKIENGVLTNREGAKNVIFLITEDSMMSYHYGFLCLDFLELSNRDDITSNPYKWFNEWKTLLGNTIRTKMVYDVIGEMKTIAILQNQGLQPVWDSIKEGTFDISCDGKLYEVKTTKTRSDSFVTIHNQFQLAIENLNQELFISFVRVEESDAGESIDELANALVSNGYDKLELENYLSKIGFAQGKEDRNKKYIIHEMKFYPVNEEFPKITKSSFVDNKIPDGVIKYEYTISLDGLENKQII